MKPETTVKDESPKDTTTSVNHWSISKNSDMLLGRRSTAVRSEDEAFAPAALAAVLAAASRFGEITDDDALAQGSSCGERRDQRDDPDAPHDGAGRLE